MVEERRPRREEFSEPCCTVVDRTFPLRLPGQAPVVHRDVTGRCERHTAALPGAGKALGP
ncbi:hypothetical protein E6R18_24810 [Streptomyces sp. A1277]|nr:hypothetical protein E6R18_24810 [Streptomyces sp. A1277]